MPWIVTEDQKVVKCFEAEDDLETKLFCKTVHVQM